MPLLNKLDLSLNNLLGPIPSTISNCKKLGSLDLSWNNLSGEIPLQIEYIPDLYLLNLSHNHLSGHIPPQLQLVQTLSVIDFSYNNLSGQIPHFKLTIISAFVGNPFLCGDVLPIMQPSYLLPQPHLSSILNNMIWAFYHGWSGCWSQLLSLFYLWAHVAFSKTTSGTSADILKETNSPPLEINCLPEVLSKA
jgi:hypothetical protein